MIPKQLQDCKFCKVRYKSKKPYEFDWPNKHYSYTEMIAWLNTIKENYGTHLGLNQLAVLDDDTNDRRLLKLYEKHFPKTFMVREHNYLRLFGWDCLEIVLEDEEGNAIGELKGLNHQAIGSGSIHPSGEVYELKQDLPIVEIQFEDFKKVFGKYFRKPKAKIVREFKKINWTGENITDIPISSIISFVGLKDRGNGIYQGSNPFHGSKGGLNFVVNNSQDTWYCFRCSSGGGPAELIAVAEGIIDCSQAGPSCFTGEQGREVIKVAREKYGLKSPEQDLSSLEPMGWAKSINIKKMAERRGLQNCPKCSGILDFNERLGWFKCKSCKGVGGIKKLIELNQK